jgi:aspartate racemase
MVKATAERIKGAGMNRVGLLGTRFTMESSFYRDRLGSYGIETVIPDLTEREFINRTIIEELCRGIIVS